MDQLPNYRTHTEDSDNGGDAVELAQFYMLLDKEGACCPHGVNYETGIKEGQVHTEPEGRTLELSWPDTKRICPCCCKIHPGGPITQGQIDVPENSTYCHLCKP